MGRSKRNVEPASSVYPPTPASGRETRTSSIFPYSVERPPTGFNTPPVAHYDMNLVSPPNHQLDPFADRLNDEEEEPVDTRETPMYARSDWGATTGIQTAFDQENFPPHPAPPAGRPPSRVEEGEEEEEMMDTRETPMYARSDWGADTGTQTAFDQEDVPTSLAPLAPRRHLAGGIEVGGPKTIWSRSSYHSQRDSLARPGLGDEDVYTGQAPETAWTQSSYNTQPLRPALTSTPLPPTPSRPPKSPARAITTTKQALESNKKTKTKSRHLVKNQSYGSALKRAGSRKASQLVDITELSEDSQSRRSSYSAAGTDGPRVAQIIPHGQADNPFSPVFAAASQREEGYQPKSTPLSGQKRHHRSTLPSILDLEHLGARSGQAKTPRTRGRPHSAGPGLALDPPTFPRLGAESPRLLTPEAQNRLGRMSVATARYSLPPSRSNGTRSASGTGTRSNPSRTSNQHSTLSASSAIKSVKDLSFIKRIKNTGLARWYRTYRAFLVAGHAVMAALLLVIALADPSSGLGYIVKVKEGGLASMPADGELGLGVSSWCQLKEKDVYATGNFASQDGSFKIPNNSIIDLLYPLWTALASILCLQALFTLSTAFLHYYLFFILHIPFNHLLDPSPHLRDDHENVNEGDQRQVDKQDIVQKEVDIRAQCERPPFEEYIWLWWAWWAFRRGPVGHIYGMVTGGLSVVCFGLGYRFKSQLCAAATPGAVHFGMGGFIPLIVLAMILDPFINAIKYFILSPRRSFNTFLQPPDPTPAAILLPQAEKPLARRRRATGLSTFYAPPTSARFTRGQTIFPSHQTDGLQTGNSPPLQPTEGLEYDDETRRWLVEYPKDPELVPLITHLRAGGHNDDFLLSDVGLLYLRPDDQDPTGAALLVPPNGVIRAEVLEDAHINEEGEHKAFLGMMSQLGEVFWWVGMEEDIERHIRQCGECSGTGAGKAETDFEEGYTGVTGWTGVDEDEKREGAMAADMAMAMRRAEEDAKKKWEA